MATASEDEAASDRCSGSYSPSADVSESETSSDCSAPTTRRFASSSSASASASATVSRRLASSSSSLPTPASAAAFYLSKPPSSDLSGKRASSSAFCLDLTPKPSSCSFPSQQVPILARALLWRQRST